jgi:hypothetical protein
MSGGRGNDLLSGQLGADEMHGDSGNDALIGGEGANKLYGESGNDRFLIWRDQSGFLAIKDFGQGDDTSVYFVDSSEAAWTTEEIQVIDSGFQWIVDRTGNTRLLRTADNSSYAFKRMRTIDNITHGPSAGQAAAGDNNGSGLIRIADPMFNPEPFDIYHRESLPVAASVVHELAHSWQGTDPERSKRWNEYSGWKVENKEWKFDAAKADAFARDYGKTDPGEDWATAWETYYFIKTRVAGQAFYPDAAKQAAMKSKLDEVDAFFGAVARSV